MIYEVLSMLEISLLQFLTTYLEKISMHKKVGFIGSGYALLRVIGVLLQDPHISRWVEWYRFIYWLLANGVTSYPRRIKQTLIRLNLKETIGEQALY
ncbi:hypothetical protein VNO77_10852 [Canavalia gladiata]|uniref:Uncharacterized protein n=1 Tax=Canavalia gladiata TaxID=3824 RepID=A0AAN9QY23_CANGL